MTISSCFPQRVYFDKCGRCDGRSRVPATWAQFMIYAENIFATMNPGPARMCRLWREYLNWKIALETIPCPDCA